MRAVVEPTAANDSLLGKAADYNNVDRIEHQL